MAWALERDDHRLSPALDATRSCVKLCLGPGYGLIDGLGPAQGIEPPRALVVVHQVPCQGAKSYVSSLIRRRDTICGSQSVPRRFHTESYSELRNGKKGRPMAYKPCSERLAASPGLVVPCHGHHEWRGARARADHEVAHAASHQFLHLIGRRCVKEAEAADNQRAPKGIQVPPLRLLLIY